MLTLADNRHTRLVGFRTTKRCEEAEKIMSVQPIYFSIDETMCKEYLTPITKGLSEEISAYGPACSQLIADSGISVNVVAESSEVVAH